MIDGADLISLETLVRYKIGEEAARLWTQAALFAEISAEVARLARRAISFEQGHLEETYTATLSSATVALPHNCYRIRNLEIYDNGLWNPLRWIHPQARYVYQSIQGNSVPLAVRRSGTNLIIESGIGTASQLRIQYGRLPAAMIYGALAAGATAGGTLWSTASPLDDIYNGDRILTVDGTGEGQFAVIEDYNGTTKAFQTTEDWATEPDDTTYISTVLPAPIDGYKDLVVLGAAIRALARRRDTELINTLSAQYAVDLAEFDSALGRVQTDQGEHVTYTPHYEED